MSDGIGLSLSTEVVDRILPKEAFCPLTIEMVQTGIHAKIPLIGKPHNFGK